MAPVLRSRLIAREAHAQSPNKKVNKTKSRSKKATSVQKILKAAPERVDFGETIIRGNILVAKPHEKVEKLGPKPFTAEEGFIFRLLQAMYSGLTHKFYLLASSFLKRSRRVLHRYIKDKVGHDECSGTLKIPGFADTIDVPKLNGGFFTSNELSSVLNYIAKKSVIGAKNWLPAPGGEWFPEAINFFNARTKNVDEKYAAYSRTVRQSLIDYFDREINQRLSNVNIVASVLLRNCEVINMMETPGGICLQGLLPVALQAVSEPVTFESIRGKVEAIYHNQGTATIQCFDYATGLHHNLSIEEMAVALVGTLHLTFTERVREEELHHFLTSWKTTIMSSEHWNTFTGYDTAHYIIKTAGFTTWYHVDDHRRPHVTCYAVLSGKSTFHFVHPVIGALQRWLYGQEGDSFKVARIRIEEVLRMCVRANHGFMIEACAGDTVFIGPGWSHLVTVPEDVEGITTILALEFGINEFK